MTRFHFDCDLVVRDLLVRGIDEVILRSLGPGILEREAGVFASTRVKHCGRASIRSVIVNAAHLSIGTLCAFDFCEGRVGTMIAVQGRASYFSTRSITWDNGLHTR